MWSRSIFVQPLGYAGFKKLRDPAATGHTGAPGRVGSSRKRSLAACNFHHFPLPTFDMLLRQRVDRHSLPGHAIAGVWGLVWQGGLLLSWHRPSWWPTHPHVSNSGQGQRSGALKWLRVPRPCAEPVWVVSLVSPFGGCTHWSTK